MLQGLTFVFLVGAWKRSLCSFAMLCSFPRLLQTFCQAAHCCTKPLPCSHHACAISHQAVFGALMLQCLHWMVTLGRPAPHCALRSPGKWTALLVWDTAGLQVLGLGTTDLHVHSLAAETLLAASAGCLQADRDAIACDHRTTSASLHVKLCLCK